MRDEELANVVLNAVAIDNFLDPYIDFSNKCYQTSLNYDKKISTESFFSLIGFIEKNVLPELYVHAPRQLHTYLNYYGDESWKRTPFEKRDLRNIKKHRGLIIQYVGTCVNGMIGQFVKDLTKDNLNIYKSMELIMEKIIEFDYMQYEEKIFKEYENFLKREREQLGSYV